MGPEATLERECAKLVESKGHALFKTKFIGRRGFPDRILVVGRPRPTPRLTRVVCVEFKRPGSVPTKAQVAVHNELRQLGMEVWVIDNLDTFTRRFHALRR